MGFIILPVLLIVFALIEKNINIKNKYMKISDKISAPVFDVIVFIVVFLLDGLLTYVISEIFSPVAIPAFAAILVYLIYIIFPERNLFEKK